MNEPGWFVLVGFLIMSRILTEENQRCSRKDVLICLRIKTTEPVDWAMATVNRFCFSGLQNHQSRGLSGRKCPGFHCEHPLTAVTCVVPESCCFGTDRLPAGHSGYEPETCSLPQKPFVFGMQAK